MNNQNNENQNLTGGNNTFVNIPTNNNSNMGPNLMNNQPFQQNLNQQIPNQSGIDSNFQQNQPIINVNPQNVIPDLNTTNNQSATNNMVYNSSQNMQQNPMNNQQFQNNFNSQTTNNGMNYNSYPQNGQPINNYEPQNTPDNKKSSKKVILIAGCLVVGLVIAIILLFGNQKTLTCTNSQNLYGMTMETKAIIKFKKNELSKAELKMTISLGEYADQKEKLIETLEESYKDEEEINVKITSDDKNIYIRLKADKNNYLGLDAFGSTTYEDVKEELESTDFNCK